MKIGLALGGGGAKGSAHLGILKAFNDRGITFDCVTGTSIGAFIGAVYANGTIDNLIEDSFRIKLKDLPVLMQPAISRKGFFSGRQVKKYLSKYIEVENIEELSIPLAIASTEINNPELFIFKNGSLSNAVWASMSIPGILTPFIDKDKMFVDGGFLEPVPVKAARDLGADIVVAIDLITCSVTREFSSINAGQGENFYDKNVFDIIQRSSIITQAKLTEISFQKSAPDIVIRPDVSEINTLDFHKSKAGLKKGLEAFNDALPSLQKYFDI